MLQPYTSSFVPTVKSSLHNQGYVTQLQLPVKRLQNLKYKHSLKNTSGERKTILIRSKLLESHSSEEDWHPSDPKKEHDVVGKIQRGIFKIWDIFYRFIHPYAVMATSLAMGIMFLSPPLLLGLLTVFIVTSAYSIELPLLRWKRNAFLSAVTTLITRGLVHVAYYVHVQKYVLGRPFVLTRSLVFALAILSLFAITFSLFKDIPDVEGDRDNGVQSFCVLAGKDKVFWLCIGMLLMGYGSAIVVGASSSCFTNKLVTVLGHAALASSLWLRAQSVDLDSKESTSSLYMFIWKLYYAEYLLIHFVR